jgi:hypothetical protein
MGLFASDRFTKDLKKIDVPRRPRDENDQIVPVKDSAEKSARLIKGARKSIIPARHPVVHGLHPLPQFCSVLSPVSSLLR